MQELDYQFKFHLYGNMEDYDAVANPEKGIKYRHAWNVVRIDGTYYHLDATFDNTLSKDDTIRYDYVNLADKQIFRDHEPVIWKVPACTDNDHFYYRVKKVSWTTVDEVRNRTRQAVKKNKILLFHWRGGYLTKEVLKELLDVFHEEAKAKEKQAYVSVTVFTFLPLRTGTKNIDSADGILILAKANLTFSLYQISLTRARHNNVTIT